jgi:hypothetical protein
MMRFAKIFVALHILLLVAVTVTAQPNHTAVVEQVRQELVARGVDLSGPCGAFQITKRVAWQLRAEGAGTLFKDSGNNCDQRSVDIVAYPTGAIVDILIDGGGQNRATWELGAPVAANRWRAAVDPEDGAGASQAAAPGALNVDAFTSFDRDVRASLGRVEERLLAISNDLTALSELQAELESKVVTTRSLPAVTLPLQPESVPASVQPQLTDGNDSAIKSTLVFLLKYGLPVVAGVFGGTKIP